MPLSAVAGSTDQAMVMAQGEKGFYRKRSTSTINAASNEELASRFLTQATFGPTRSEINSFPNINSNTFGSPGDDSFLNWIDAQIAISPFYHRAYWRERSDPDYIDESALPDRLVNEVGHNPAYGQQFAFSRGQTVYRTDWTNPCQDTAAYSILMAMSSTRTTPTGPQIQTILIGQVDQ